MGQILSFDRGAGEESSDLASKSEINLINNQKKRNGGNRLQKRSSPDRAETFSPSGGKGGRLCVRSTWSAGERSEGERLVLTLSRARRAKGPCRRW